VLTVSELLVEIVAVVPETVPVFVKPSESVIAIEPDPASLSSVTVPSPLSVATRPPLVDASTLKVSFNKLNHLVEHQNDPNLQCK